MTWRAEIELVDPNALRLWLDDSREALDARSMDREHWRNYDAARRFERSPKQRKIQTETWLTREDCYWLARLQLRLARIYLFRNWCGIGPVRETPDDALAAAEHIVDAFYYRALARDKWPADHDHPREQWSVYGHPVDDPAARKAEVVRQRKAAKDAQQALDAEQGTSPDDIEAFAFASAYRARRAIERDQRHAAYSAERAAAGLRPDEWSSIDEQHAWQRLHDAERMRAGTYVEEPGQRVHSIGTHAWLVSDPPVQGPKSPAQLEASARAYDEMLTQLGMGRDAEGRYLISRPKP